MFKIKRRGSGKVIEVCSGTKWLDPDGNPFVLACSDPLRENCFCMSMYDEDICHTFADEEFLKRCYYRGKID